MALLGCGAVAFAAPNAAECVTKTDIKSLDETFWKHYPSTDAFTRYAAPDMKIASNVADVANINETQKTGPARAGQLASFFADHPEYFGSFKTAHDATFLYYPGRDRHPDALKTVSTYPAGQCVSMFHYDLAQSQCTAGQRVRALRLSFVKEAGKLTLRVVQVAMEACP
ncbi:hypothetical protein G3N95_33355 [Paraburkholderia sp. Tr-20389]|nr:hypothetical protein [Paraburkholderia sp. Tr-20389]